VSLIDPDTSQPLDFPPPPQVSSAATVALVLETVFGWFGILGVGHAYSGRVLLAVVLLIGWWIYVAVAVVLLTLTVGISGCLVTPIYIAAPIVSGLYARAYVLRTRRTGSWGSVAIVGGAGCLVLIAVALTAALYLSVILGVIRIQ
jgi:hypothetical protein